MAKIQCNFISYTLNRTVDVDVILPSVTIPESFEGNCSHKKKDKYPVVYLLHGYGNNHAQWCGYTNVELYAEERQIAVVMISGENKKYIKQIEDDFVKFIQEELPEFITSTFPISNKKEDTFIAGLSMGGFGALYHGLSRPDLYAGVGAFSPALAMENISIHILDMLDNYKGNQQIFITCGDQDFIYDQSVKLVDKLTQLQIEHTWISKAGYAHEWRFWDWSIETFLDWLTRVDAYKECKRKV